MQESIVLDPINNSLRHGKTKNHKDFPDSFYYRHF